MTLALALGTANQAKANWEFNAPDIRIDMGVFSGDRQLSNETQIVNLGGFIDGQITIDDLAINARLQISEDNRTQLLKPEVVNEFYVSYRFDDSRVRIGRQIVSLGRADGFNPTDVLTPSNQTLLTLDETDQEQGRLGARYDHLLENWKLSAVALKDNVYDQLPIPSAPFSVIQDAISSSGMALIADYSGDQFDWGFMYYQGADLQPAFDVSSLAVGRIIEKHVDKKVIGFDVATNLGRVGIRGEVACSEYDQPDPNILSKVDNCVLVGGGDYTFDNRSNLNIQYFQINSDDFARNGSIPPSVVDAYQVLIGQSEPKQNGLLVRYAVPFANDTVLFEFPFAVSLDKEDIAVRPRLGWKINDQYSLKVGIDYFVGDERGVFGRLKENTIIYCGLQINI